MNVDLGGRALDRVAGFLVRRDADEVTAVEDPVDPGDVEIALDLVPPRVGRERLPVYLPRVLDARARLGLASQAHRQSLDDRVLRGTHGEVQVAVLATDGRHCEEETVSICL